MATTLTPHTLNLSLCLRLSVAQTVIPVSACFCTVAGDERSARRSLVRDYVLSLAARLPVVEVSRA